MWQREAGSVDHPNPAWCLRSGIPGPAAPQEPAEDDRGAAAEDGRGGGGEEDERGDGEPGEWRSADTS